jgi:hypothetical protein
MQAHILAVMESWPPQLLLLLDRGERAVVALSETATVIAKGRSVGLAGLQVGQLVELDLVSAAQSSAPAIVQAVRILSP